LKTQGLENRFSKIIGTLQQYFPKPSETLWYPDSAMTPCMTSDEDILSSKTPYLGSIQLKLEMIIYFLFLTLEAAYSEFYTACSSTQT